MTLDCAPCAHLILAVIRKAYKDLASRDREIRENAADWMFNPEAGGIEGAVQLLGGNLDAVAIRQQFKVLYAREVRLKRGHHWTPIRERGRELLTQDTCPHDD